jgi:hypothetical protein
MADGHQHGSKIPNYILLVFWSTSKAFIHLPCSPALPPFVWLLKTKTDIDVLISSCPAGLLFKTYCTIVVVFVADIQSTFAKETTRCQRLIHWSVVLLRPSSQNDKNIQIRRYLFLLVFI